MARKRLSLSGPFAAPPAREDAPPLPRPEAKALGGPPIARIAGEASASAALDDLAEAWTQARETGRLVQALPLDAVDENWLVRDRLSLDNEEMADLVESIRERGQQVPVEVVSLPEGRFGLISGWRRLRALKVLREGRDGERFAHVLALLRRPAGAAEAYRAMVEENEIRANLSYYERARIAARAAEAGAFADARAAVTALFAAGSRAKRSKIVSFLTLVEALDDRLHFAGAIPERLGLQLAKALDEAPGLRETLRERLRKGAPDSAERELALLTRGVAAGGLIAGGAGAARTALSAAKPGTPADPELPLSPTAGETLAAPHREEILPGLWLETDASPGLTRATLSGPRLDPALLERLVAWLKDAR
ncbi:MAG: ParB/RepB/Spo0J family partition protein [Pararhodobacter sp.]